MSNWATDMAALMSEGSRSAAKGQRSNVLHIAEIASTQPLSINVNGQNISKFLYINPDNFRIEVGDKIVVMQSRTSFYILQKVVAV